MAKDEYSDGVKAGAMGAMEAALIGVARRESRSDGLAKATMAGRAAVLTQGPYGDALARADRDAETASQALRDLGVDVDALLGDP